MKYETILYEKEGQVVYITLNMPQRLNAVGPDILRDWLAGITAAEEDDDVKIMFSRAPAVLLVQGLT